MTFLFAFLTKNYSSVFSGNRDLDNSIFCLKLKVGAPGDSPSIIRHTLFYSSSRTSFDTL